MTTPCISNAEESVFALIARAVIGEFLVFTRLHEAVRHEIWGHCSSRNRLCFEQ